jgi:peptidoglycan hydrolase CwlO-like protein
MNKLLLVMVLFFVPPSFAQAPVDKDEMTMTGTERAWLVQHFQRQEATIQELEEALDKAAKYVEKLQGKTGCT